MPKEFAPEYMTALRRYHKNHPEAEAAAHRALLGGLPTEVAAEIVKQNAPDVAYHSQAGQIGGLPKSRHAAAVAALHAAEQRGPSSETETESERDNRETEEYLGSRAVRKRVYR